MPLRAPGRARRPARQDLARLRRRPVDRRPRRSSRVLDAVREEGYAGWRTYVRPPPTTPEVSSMLTGRQQEIWKYLTDYVDAHGYPPTVREIGEAGRLASPSTVHAPPANLGPAPPRVPAHRGNPERPGRIKRAPGKPRALELRRDPKPTAAQADDVHRLPL